MQTRNLERPAPLEGRKSAKRGEVRQVGLLPAQKELLPAADGLAEVAGVVVQRFPNVVLIKRLHSNALFFEI